ncbi:hypothetical protein LEMLEM_LOCUS21956 [Lemmus lemmus]
MRAAAGTRLALHARYKIQGPDAWIPQLSLSLALPFGPSSGSSRHWPPLHGYLYCFRIVPPFAPLTFWLEQPAAFLSPGRLALETGRRWSCPWSALSVASPPPSPATAAQKGVQAAWGSP